MLAAAVVALWGLLIIGWCAWVRPVQNEKAYTGIVIGKAYALAFAVQKSGYHYHLQVRADKLRCAARDIARIAAGIESETWWKEMRKLISNTQKRWELRRMRKEFEQKIVALEEIVKQEKQKSPS